MPRPAACCPSHRKRMTNLSQSYRFPTKMLAGVLLALAPLVATPATATAMKIVLTGTFDGSLAGKTFSKQAVTFTGLSDTTGTEEVFDELHHPLSSLTAAWGGKTYKLNEATIFFVAPLSDLAGIVDPDASKGLVRFDYGAGNAFYTDDMTQAFTTSGGALLLRAGSGIRLAGLSLPATTPAVPEPATWAMLLLGFAVTGTALRRRPAVGLRAA